MSQIIPAIVIGAHANGTGVVRSLGRAGIVVDVVRTLKTDIAHHSRFVRDSFALPDISTDPDALVGFLESHLDRWKGGVVIPTNDHALIGMAKNHARLSGNFRLTCEPWDVVERLINKSITVRHASKAGISVPEVYGKAIRSFGGSQDLVYPVLVKPVQGHQFAHEFNCKLFLVNTSAELNDVIARVEDKGFDCDIVEFVVGPDTAIRHFQVYIDAGGRPHGAFTFRKLRQEPPLFGVARACETVDAPELYDPTLALLQSIGWRGIASVAWKRDTRTGRDYLMEINGRSPLSHGLARRAGINYALMAYSEASEGVIRGCEPNGWKGNWIHMHADFFMTIKNYGNRDARLRDIIASYRGPKTFAVWARDDPKPFIAQWWHSAKETPAWITGRFRRVAGALRLSVQGHPGRPGGK